jgi:hypothetical protein
VVVSGGRSASGHPAGNFSVPVVVPLLGVVETDAVAEGESVADGDCVGSVGHGCEVAVLVGSGVAGSGVAGSGVAGSGVEVLVGFGVLRVRLWSQRHHQSYCRCRCRFRRAAGVALAFPVLVAVAVGFALAATASTAAAGSAVVGSVVVVGVGHCVVEVDGVVASVAAVLLDAMGPRVMNVRPQAAVTAVTARLLGRNRITISRHPPLRPARADLAFRRKGYAPERPG